jgi:hypothetical protein
VVTFCETFRSIASQTWDKLAQAKSVNMQISEQSFTNFNLLDIKLRHQQNVDIITFGTNAESKNGADWELWIEDKGLYMGFRMQAKVIDLSTHRYKQLYDENKNIYQCDTLIKSALKPKCMLFPLYCLYTYWEWSKFPDFHDITRRTGAKEHFGCSLLDPFTVLSLRNTKNNTHIKKLLHGMSPWSTLVCPMFPNKPDLDGIDLDELDFNQLDSHKQAKLNSYQQELNKINIVEHATKTCSTWCCESLEINHDLIKNLDDNVDNYLSKIKDIKPYKEPPQYVRDIIETGHTNVERNDIQHIVILRCGSEGRKIF